MIGYTCKYTPVELLKAFGAEPVLMNREAENFDCAQNLVHMNMCSHIKAFLENVNKDGLRELILVNCCDSVRRAYDVLREKMDFIFIMDLPHNDNTCARQHLADELMRLADEYGKYCGRSFDKEAFAAAFRFEQRELSEKYIGIMGARIGDGLFEKLQEMIPMRVEDFTCNSNRRMAEKVPELEFRELMEWYAAELIGQLPCMRMADASRRRELTEDPCLEGIIYHTVKFCDYYGFEYEQLRRRTDVPMLKIETDFTMQSLGQLSTRIGGFVESMGIGEEKMTVKSGIYFAGIDSGSTTTNVAVLDREGNLVDSAIVRTGARAQQGAEKAFGMLKIPREEIALIVATGYGRKNITIADTSITEITCHARGAFHLNRDVRTIIDIGGQDSKAISLDKDGNVKNFAMNDKCAAGTGRFLENMAKVLETDLDGMSTIGLDWKEDITISSMCTVFAESEVVSLIADNKQIGDIVHGLNKSVASKTLNLVNRVGAESRYMMTGGGARNKGVVECIEEQLGEKIFVPEIPDLCGAVGAALFALDAAADREE
jgi:predicted CoA-substrate-specific enzyme activase